MFSNRSKERKTEKNLFIWKDLKVTQSTSDWDIGVRHPMWTTGRESGALI